MTPQIGYRVVEQNQLVDALADVWSYLDADDTSLSAWLENPVCEDGLRLCDADITSHHLTTLVDRWTEGRLFGASGEVRWICLDTSRVHLVLLSDRGVPGRYEAIRNLEYATEEEEEERLLLWGRYTTGKGWSEDRIPVLRYPAHWRGEYAAIIARRYELGANIQRPYDSYLVRYIRYDGGR